MADQPNIYVKLGRDGNVIERTADTPTDHVQFRGTGWVLKDSATGKRVTNPKKSDDVSKVSAASVTLHAAAAQLGGGEDAGAKPAPAASTKP